MKRTPVLLAAALLSCDVATAQAIEGRYRIEGSNPGSSAVYKGEALIKKTGSTYSVVWQTGSSKLVGTGLITGQVLSVVFSQGGSSKPGVASFSIVNDHVQGGAWAALGGEIVGNETWSAE